MFTTDPTNPETPEAEVAEAVAAEAVEVAATATARPMAKTVAAGWVFSSLASVFARGSVFITQIVLARLLTREDFGVAGLANAMGLIGSLVMHAGLSQVLISRQQRDGDALRNAAGLSCVIGALSAALLLGAGPIGAHVYHEPRLIGMMAVVAVTSFLSAMSSVPSAKLLMDLRYRDIAALASFEAVLSTVLACTFAWAGMGVYAFVVPAAVVAVVRLTLIWRMAGLKMTVGTDVAMWRSLATSSGWLFVASVAFTLVNQGDYLLVGLFCGKDAVGTYYLAFALAMQFVAMVTSNGASVLLPALAQIREPERRVKGFVRSVRVLGFAAVPLCVVQAVAARPLVECVFREKWIAAVPLVQVFSIGVVMRLASAPAGAYIISQGRFFTRAMQALVAAPLFLGAVAAGAALHGTMGAAVAEILYFSTVEVALTYWIIRPDGGTAGDLWRIYVPPVRIAAMAAVVLLPFLVLLRVSGTGAVVSLLIAGVASAVFLGVYAVLVRRFEPEAWAEFRTHGGSIVERFRRPR